MNALPLQLLLADDDMDDCLLFKEALEELHFAHHVTTVSDGVDLLKWLNLSTSLPDILFLDLNMPRKNGFECLAALKSDQTLQKIPVIVLSTALDPTHVERLYNEGAHFYMRKPRDFSTLKKLLHSALTRLTKGDKSQPNREQFILTGEH